MASGGWYRGIAHSPPWCGGARALLSEPEVLVDPGLVGVDPVVADLVD